MITGVVGEQRKTRQCFRDGRRRCIPKDCHAMCLKVNKELKENSCYEHTVQGKKYKSCECCGVLPWPPGY